MTAAAYERIIAAPRRERLGPFLETANRLGATIANLENDFWVCRTLTALYRERPAGGPRLLFKGGTSLSKALSLTRRFSEDIDITTFRDNLGEPASVDDLDNRSSRKRRAWLAAIRDACRSYTAGPLHEFLAAQFARATADSARTDIDSDDTEGQTLLNHYPAVAPADSAYGRPVVRVEAGMKSALDPNRSILIRLYVADWATGLDLTVHGVSTIEPVRSFWDKIVIAHGLRRWHERRGVLRHEGQRVSRQYCDLHCLLGSTIRKAALECIGLGADCVMRRRFGFVRMRRSAA